MLKHTIVSQLWHTLNWTWEIRNMTYRKCVPSDRNNLFLKTERKKITARGATCPAVPHTGPPGGSRWQWGRAGSRPGGPGRASRPLSATTWSPEGSDASESETRSTTKQLLQWWVSVLLTQMPCGTQLWYMTAKRTINHTLQLLGSVNSTAARTFCCRQIIHICHNVGSKKLFYM